MAKCYAFFAHLGLLNAVCRGDMDTARQESEIFIDMAYSTLKSLYVALDERGALSRADVKDAIASAAGMLETYKAVDSNASRDSLDETKGAA